MSANSTEDAKSTEPTEEAKAFGRYLRNLRKLKGLNQAELAQRVEITGGYYGFFEQGRQIPSLKIINRLADVLDADYLEMAQKAGYDEFEARKKELPRTSYAGSTITGAGTGSGSTGSSNDADQETAEDGGDETAGTDNNAGADRPQEGAQKTSTTEDAVGGVTQERLDWALMCIASDPTYKLAEQFTQGALPENVKALVVQLYQAQTMRQLLTPGESAALNAMVHG